MVIAPLRVQVHAIQRRADSGGLDEYRQRTKDRPGDPHGGSAGLGYWVDDAKRHGVANAFELAHSHPELVALVERLDEFRRRPEPQPKPVAVGDGEWTTPALWD